MENVRKWRTERHWKTWKELRKSLREDCRSKGFKMRVFLLLYETKMDPSHSIEAYPILAVNLLLNLRRRIQKVLSTNTSDQYVMYTHHPSASSSSTFNATVVRVLESVTVRLLFLVNVRKHQIIGTVIKDKSLTNEPRQFRFFLP